MVPHDKHDDWVAAQVGLPHMVAGTALYSTGGPMLKEFKEFAMRGSVLDMAVGIVIGASFGKIITSFVDDILMPPVGLLFGRMDFANLFVSLTGQHYDSLAAAKSAGAATLNYGLFLNSLINFLIIAFAIFLLVRQVNRLKRAQTPPPPPTTRDCPFCFLPIPLKATKCGHCTSSVEAA